MNTMIVHGIDAASGSMGVAKNTNCSKSIGNNNHVPICMGLYGFWKPLVRIVFYSRYYLLDLLYIIVFNVSPTVFLPQIRNH